MELRPQIEEQIYSLEDALATSDMMRCFVETTARPPRPVFERPYAKKPTSANFDPFHGSLSIHHVTFTRLLPDVMKAAFNIL